MFIGKRAELYARKGYGQLILGRWVHIGEENRLRVHEGTLRVGDKTVFGRDNTINTYLDIEIGGSCIVADWVYVCDFDHVFEDVNLPIKDQGIVKAPVRIGPDCWLGNQGHRDPGNHGPDLGVCWLPTPWCGAIPPKSVVGARPHPQGPAGNPRRVTAARREALADIARKTRVAAGEHSQGG